MIEEGASVEEIVKKYEAEQKRFMDIRKSICFTKKSDPCYSLLLTNQSHPVHVRYEKKRAYRDGKWKGTI